MLSNKAYEGWSQQRHEDREYDTEVERRFFDSVENPKPPTEGLKELVREYGKYASK